MTFLFVNCMFDIPCDSCGQSKKCNKPATTFGIEIYNETGNVYTIHAYCDEHYHITKNTYYSDVYYIRWFKEVKDDKIPDDFCTERP